MKAVQFSRFGGPEVLELVDLPDPHPGPNQMRITVRAAGINASDWKKRQGLLDQELPQTLGYEAAGIVDELGDGVTDVAIGDRVFGLASERAVIADCQYSSRLLPYARGNVIRDVSAQRHWPSVMQVGRGGAEVNVGGREPAGRVKQPVSSTQCTMER